MKAQAAIVDAMLFVIVASIASILVIFSAGQYGISTLRQASSAYAYEFINSALVAMHYEGGGEDYFWPELYKELSNPRLQISDLSSFLCTDYPELYKNLTKYSPGNFSLCFEKDSNIFCMYKDSNGCVVSNGYPSKSYPNTYVGSSHIGDWRISLRIYY
ncbi:hypothetical protein DRN74_00120 [Candidatus Micrarchaeota archaeon]|nr:MAG: hypothetical protein DRN74_00120 [Candidatus Micrarchaeota archaeon]